LEALERHVLMESGRMPERLRGGKASGVSIDYSQWPEHALASPLAYLYQCFVTRAYACRCCGSRCEFSAADQKRAVEVEKRRLQWQPTLCDRCYAERCGLERELRAFRLAWLTQRKSLAANAASLWRWLERLEAAPAYGLRRNSAMIGHLRKRLGD
jgi:hypothetical protein